MSRVLLEEKQSRSKSIFIWIVMILSSAPIVTIFSIAAYQQLLLGKSWGNNPMSDEGLIVLMIVMLLILLGAGYVALGSTLHTKVTSDAVEYKYPPLIRKWRTIEKQSIANISRKQRSLINKGSIRKTAFSKTIEISVLGWEQVCINLTNGEKVILGTQNPDLLEHTIKKITTPIEN